jgi:hypothetical protein
LQAVGADGGGAHDGFAEAREDGAAEDGFVALYFARRGAVVGGGEEEDEEEGAERDSVVIVVGYDEDEDAEWVSTCLNSVFKATTG